MNDGLERFKIKQQVYHEYAIKELENGEKWEVKLDSKYQEILIKRIK